jgi:hypothetical protein
VKGRALRRALATTDVTRVNAEVPLIEDSTELITPAVAQEFLSRNQNNRPVNWKTVEQYADAMAAGHWQLHAQGLVLDTNGNVLTGQQRLWAVIYSGVNVYMRVSRGNPPSVAPLLDRGRPQSSRDLAARATGRKHSPTEASMARAIRALQGDLRPSVDALAETITEYASAMQTLLLVTVGTKKTKAVLMIAGAILVAVKGESTVGGEVAKHVTELAHHITLWAQQLEAALAPQTSSQCWGKGAAFGLAMEAARKIVWERS